MSIFSKVKSAFGFDNARTAPAPAYHTICDGLIVTALHAEAWFEIGVSNLDTAADEAWDSELDRVIRAAGKAAGERPCHLKIMWSKIDGTQYYNSVQDLYDDEYAKGKQWAEDYADRIDSLGLPQRHVMLGVLLEERDTATAAALKKNANAAVGLAAERLSDEDFTHYMNGARRILKTLGSSPLKAKLVSAEKIAWMIARESGRTKAPLSSRDRIEGAALQHILSSKVIPYPNHLELLDEAGNTVMYQAILPIIDFPEEVIAPGNSQWATLLSYIQRLETIYNEDTEETEAVHIPVFPDVSIRFQNVPRKEAIKRVNEARRTAKEQRQSAAKTSAGEPGEEIEDAELQNEALLRDIRRGGTYLVEHNPCLIVSASSLEELEDNVQAVTEFFLNEEILLARGEDEQRDLWLENLPGDTLRVTDLSHVQTDVAFYGMFFWAGAKVGDKKGGAVGYTEGITTDLFRSNIASSGERGDTTSTAYAGRSGRGKTTAMGLEMVSQALERPSWFCMIDAKGDSGGISLVASEYGIDSGVIKLTSEHSGAADMFRALSRDRAPIAVQSILQMQAKDRKMSEVAASASLRYATEEAENAEFPSTYGVIERMAKAEDKDVRDFASYLFDLSKTPIGAIVLGKPSSKVALTDKPGLWVIQVQNLSLPNENLSFSDWDAQQRLSVSLIQGITNFAMSVSSNESLRAMRKLVAVPEVHILMRAINGVAFLDQLARIGRAFNTGLAYDTQDCTSIADMPGLVEQLQGVRIFQFTSEEQQNAAAKLLGLPVNAETRAMIRSLADDPESDQLRKGRALVRDWREEVARVQFDFPSERVRALMSTDPENYLRDMEQQHFYEEQENYEEVEVA